MNSERNLPYYDTNPKDIFRYSRELLGQNFVDVLSSVFEDDKLKERIDYYNDPKGKGTLGNLLEEHYFFTNLIVAQNLILIKQASN